MQTLFNGLIGLGLMLGTGQVLAASETHVLGQTSSIPGLLAIAIL